MILLLLAGLSTGLVDDYERGMALARGDQWDEARATFLEGQRKAPRDKRFPLELAGIAYRDRDLPAARRLLQQALHLDPHDRYGNNFLGTLYFLEGNLDAALRYWNAVGKPLLEDVRFDPPPRLDPALLGRLPAFSAGGMLAAADLQTTRARLDALGVFRRYRIELIAKPEERFGVAVTTVERPRWNNLPALLRGLPFQTGHFDLLNVRGSGVNWTSLLRWDAQKRRAATTVEGPLRQDPARRYALWLDTRREVWNTGEAEDFRLGKEEFGAELRMLSGPRLEWRSGVQVARRAFSNAPELRPGTSLGYRTGVSYRWLTLPERRLEADSSARWEVARMLTGTRDVFSRTQASVSARWLPRALGTDVAMTTRFRAGKTLGRTPFDELFLLGIERDNDLWLRGHAGTRHGKKGSAPLGRDYALLNWEIDKELFRHSLFTILAGPLLDAGRPFGAARPSDPEQWLWDAGAQLKVRVLGSWTAVLSYGRDLHSGRGAFYISFLP